jgi:hypothetical protein
MKILITGDSWGRGEWGVENEQYKNTHPGLQLYFEEDGHEVVNVSSPGGHNTDAYVNVANLLPKEKFDIILWIQADPLRDLKPENYDPIKHDMSTFDELLAASNRLAAQAYKNFGSINHKIYCLGGGGKINLDLIAPYKNLIPIVPSITELVLPDYKHPDLWASDWIFLIDRQFDIDSVDKILENKKRQDMLGSRYANYFYPDGDHPNRHGWRVVYDHLKNILDF